MSDMLAFEQDKYAVIAAELADHGWSICHDFQTQDQVVSLATESRLLWHDGGFRVAGIGSGQDRRVEPHVRGDHVHWLDEASLSPSQQMYFHELEQLRLAINGALYLGLFEYEGHLTVYPPGNFYRKHLDRFHGSQARVVSCILYLNQAWSGEDGGALRLYLEPSGEGKYVDILPRGGTLVAFLSANFYHEVQPARRERLSLTGWFRVRTGIPGK